MVTKITSLAIEEGAVTSATIAAGAVTVEKIYVEGISAAGVTTATNLADGGANRIAYQQAVGQTTFVTAPTTSSTYLQWNGSEFTWASSVGPQGPTGPSGANGTIGVDGATGPQGPQGPGSPLATQFTITNTTQASSTTTGALQVAGGAGIGGKLYVGGDVVFSSTGTLTVPSGTTAQRPGTPVVGMVRYNSTTGYGEMYTSAGWATIGSPPPSISSVTPSTFNGEQGTTFTINGANFTNDAVVKFITNGNVEYTAGNVAFVNSSQLTATTPRDFTVAEEPLDVKVVQASGSATSVDTIDCGGTPSWTTAAGTLATYVYPFDASYSTSVSATDPDAGATISYSLTSGSLPTSASLNTSTGAITGSIPNPNSSSVTSTFDVTATDNAGNTSTRTFNIIRQWADGSTAARANTSASAIKTLTGTTSDGVYYIKPSGGSGTAFQTYCIMSRDGGGWMKILQYYGGTSMNTSSAINAGGTWVNAEINAAAGKLTNADILALQANGTNTSFLFRVTGGSDNLLNNGSGTGKFAVASGVLANWGTSTDPTVTHTFSLDMTSDGTYEYACTYTNDTRALCTSWSGVGGGVLWYTDHNYNGTFGSPPPNASTPQCYGFLATGLGTNLHWMSGLSTQSAGSIGWGGTSNSSSASIFIK